MVPPAKSVTVFLSCCHKNKAMAQKIDKDFSAIGISIIRDEHELQYTDSLSEFMKRINPRLLRIFPSGVAGISDASIFYN